MTTPNDIITISLNQLGVIPIGEAIPAHLSTLGLARLNTMLKLWAIENIQLPVFIKDTLTLVDGTTSYTIGASGVFNTARPVKLENAYIRDSDNTDYPLDVYNDLHKYNALAEKDTEGRPYEIYYEATNPLGIIYFYYTPDAAYTVYLTSEKSLTSFASLSEDLTLPPEYELALGLNLAVSLMPAFGKKDVQVDRDAELAKNALINNNSNRYMREANFDNALLKVLWK